MPASHCAPDDDAARWRDALFCLGLALLASHELDAVARHEWRLLPGLNGLADGAGYVAFVLLHVPLFTGLFWATGHASPAVRRRSQLAIDGFLVVHAGLHLVLSRHALYEFQPPVETVTVYGGALAGALHLTWTSRRARGR